MNPETLKQSVINRLKQLRGMKEYNTSIEMLSFRRNQQHYKQYRYLRILKGILSEYHHQQLITSNLPNHNLRFNIDGVNNTDIDCWIKEEYFGIDVKTSKLYPKPDIMKKNNSKFWFFCSIIPKYDDMTTTKQIGSKLFTYLNVKSDKIWDVDNWEMLIEGYYPVKGFQNEFLPDRFIQPDTFYGWINDRLTQ
jgi:hypothetical protein